MTKGESGAPGSRTPIQIPCPSKEKVGKTATRVETDTSPTIRRNELIRNDYMRIKETLDNEIKELYRMLKSECHTYGELEKLIKETTAFAEWDDVPYGTLLGARLTKLLKKDICDMKMNFPIADATGLP